MNILQSLFILLLVPCTLADVDFTVPTIGTNFKAGDVVTAHWRESGQSPRISELSQYDLYLYAGGDTADTQVSCWALQTVQEFLLTEIRANSKK
jgi:hypothetical protein